MSDLGRIIMFVGAALVIVGAILWLVGRTGFRGIPGDVAYEGERVRFYFPIVTCIVISVVLTLAFWLLRWLRGG